MRTIKFRGKRIDGQGWAYGWSLGPNLIIPLDTKYTNTSMGLILHDYYEVLPESVGQWTGLVDRHGTEIFEGDVIYGENYLFPVYDFRKMAVTWNEKSGGFDMDIFDQENIEIVGNIHDNPELMEVA